MNSDSGAFSTLRARVVLDLPSEVEFVRIEVRVAHLKRKIWKSNVVPVTEEGSSLIEFWIRVPHSHGINGAKLSIKARLIHLIPYH